MEKPPFGGCGRSDEYPAGLGGEEVGWHGGENAGAPVAHSLVRVRSEVGAHRLGVPFELEAQGVVGGRIGGEAARGE